MALLCGSRGQFGSVIAISNMEFDLDPSKKFHVFSQFITVMAAKMSKIMKKVGISLKIQLLLVKNLKIMCSIKIVKCFE